MKQRSRLEKIFIGIVWLIRIIIIATIGYMLWNGKLYETKILVITFALTFFDWMMKKLIKLQFPIAIRIGLILFIFAAQYLGTVMDWYGMFYWWDTMLHTISGGLFFFIGIYILQKIGDKTISCKLSIPIILLFGICFSLSVGVLWEIIEFVADSFFGANMQRAIGEVGRGAIMDTMTDLMVAGGGSLITALYYYWNKKHLNT